MTRPLKILVAHNVLCGRPGGMSHIMRFIHDVVAARSGHQVQYLCSEHVPPFVRGRLGRVVFPWAVWAGVRDAQRAGRPYDVVNVHEPSGAVVTVLRGTRNHPRVIVTTHGVERRGWELASEERQLGRDHPSLKSRILYPLTSLWQSDLALRHADHVFCLSLDDQRYLSDRLGVTATRITRIYPGANESYAAASRGRDYARADRVLFAGTWRKNKGIEDLVPAFTRLATHNPAVTLTVLGGGVSADVVAAAFPTEVRARVRYIETVTETESIAHFTSSDIFLLPSLFEGTPLTLIEAMMSGLPIVTTATCGMTDVITSEVNGLLVPIRSPEAIVSSLERLMADPELRARLGLTAQRDALAHYTWTVVARPVAEVYQRLAAATAS